MKPEFVIISPLLEEWEAVCRRLKSPETVGDAKRGIIGNYDVVCVRSGWGQAGAADTLSRILVKWKPRYVLLVGIAGGFGRFELGDVLVAKHVLAYESGWLEDGTFSRLPENDFSPDRVLLRHAEARIADKEWRKRVFEQRPDGEAPEKSNANLGYVVSGDKVIDDPNHEFFREVRTKFDEIDGVEMEAVGSWAAIRTEMSQRAVGFLMIRSISDLPDRHISGTVQGEAERAQWKRYAADAAAAFTEDFLSTFQKQELRWDALIDGLLDRHFSSLSERLGKSAREAIEEAFGTRLDVIPTREKFPAIMDPDHLDPDILLEARLDSDGRAFERRVPVSSSDLELLQLYHEPSNYQKILEQLKRDKILFLCGNAGVGKSLSALRIVKDFFQLGVRPFIPPLPTPTLSAWEKLENLEPSEILFLDDPFGNSQYIGSSSDPRIEKLTQFLDDASQKDTGYLLISTRTNVFNQFLDDVNNHDIQYRLKTRRIILNPENYTPEVRRTLLKRYAENYRCQWYQPAARSEDVNKIVSAASGAIVLPLNIKHFCYETDDLVDTNNVLGQVEPYRDEPLERYLNLLQKANEAQILYLIFAKYLQNAFLTEKNLKGLFRKISHFGKSNEVQWSACKRFFRSWFEWEEFGRCRITHPTIEEALNRFFEENCEAQAQLNNTFLKILNLPDYEDALATAVMGMIQAIDQLSVESKAMLSECQSNPSPQVRISLSQALASNIPDVGTNNRELFEIMLKVLLNETNSAVRSAAMSAIFSNVVDCGDDLEKQAANLKKDPDPCVRRQLAWAIASNFEDAISSRKILKYLALDDPDRWVRIATGEAIMDSYENLDKNAMELWKKLLRDEQVEVRRAMIGAFEANFTELPGKYKSIFLEIAEDQDFAIIEWVIWFIQNKYDELHNAFKDDLHQHLRGFAKHPDASVRKWVAEALGENLDSLDDDCRGLLKGLIEDRSPLVRDVACGFFG